MLYTMHNLWEMIYDYLKNYQIYFVLIVPHHSFSFSTG